MRGRAQRRISRGRQAGRSHRLELPGPALFEPARSPSAMPPHVTTPHERAPLPGGIGHIRTKSDTASRTFFTSPERERSSWRQARPGEGPTLRGGACSAFCPAAGALIPAPHPVRRPLRTSVRRRFAAASCAGSRIAFHCASLRSRLPGKGWLRDSHSSLHRFPGRMQRKRMRPGTQRKNSPRSGAELISQQPPFGSGGTHSPAAHSRRPAPPRRARSRGCLPRRGVRLHPTSAT